MASLPPKISKSSAGKDPHKCLLGLAEVLHLALPTVLFWAAHVTMFELDAASHVSMLLAALTLVHWPEVLCGS